MLAIWAGARLALQGFWAALPLPRVGIVRLVVGWRLRRPYMGRLHRLSGRSSRVLWFEALTLIEKSLDGYAGHRVHGMRFSQLDVPD